MGYTRMSDFCNRFNLLSFPYQRFSDGVGRSVDVVESSDVAGPEPGEYMVLFYSF